MDTYPAQPSGPFSELWASHNSCNNRKRGVLDKVVFPKPGLPHLRQLAKSRQRVGLQSRKHTVAVQKCKAALDHAGSRFFGKFYFKLQKFITYLYGIQIIHNLLHWNPLENGEKTDNFFNHFNNSK
jgi:hypothetical protein